MNIFNNNVLCVVILFILLPIIFKYEIRELFTNTNNLHLSSTYNNMNSYQNNLNDSVNVMDGSINNLLKGRSDVYLKDKIMTSFDSLNFNKAFIDTLKIQNLEDRYIYKLKQKL